MKKLTVKEILITIISSYLIVSFINAELNPFNLSIEDRIIEIIIIVTSLGFQLASKNI